MDKYKKSQNKYDHKINQYDVSKLFLEFLKFIIVIKLRTDEIIKYIYYINSLHMGLNYVNQYFVFRCDLINITENRKIVSFKVIKKKATLKQAI